MNSSINTAKELIKQDPKEAYKIIKSIDPDALDPYEYLDYLGMYVHLAFFYPEDIEYIKSKIKVLNDEIDKKHEYEYKIRLLTTVAALNLSIKNYIEALELFKRSINLAIENNNIQDQIKSYSNYGYTLLVIKMYDEAIINFKKSKELIEIHGTTSVVRINNESNMASYYIAVNNYDMAYYYVKSIIDEADKDELKVQLSEIYLNMSKVLIFKGKLKEADSYLEIAVKQSIAINDYNYIIRLYTFYIEYKMKSNIKRASELLSEALEYLEGKVPPVRIYKLFEFGAIIYNELGDTKRTLEFYRKVVNHGEKYSEDIVQEYKRSLDYRYKINQSEIDSYNLEYQNKELKKRTDELNMMLSDMETLNNIIEQLINSKTEREVLSYLFKNIIRLYDVKYFMISFVEDDELSIISREIDEEDGYIEYENTIEISAEWSILAYVVREKKDVIINDYHNEYNKYTNLKKGKDYGVNSLLAYKLEFADEVIGVISVQSEGKDKFSQYEIDMFKLLALNVSIAISNVRKVVELNNNIRIKRQKQEDLEYQNKKLDKLSYIDTLTNILNRRSFNTRFKKEVDRAKRLMSSMSVLMIDIDYFKEYNDNYGHLMGDECIKAVSWILENSLRRKTDFVARYGGDEFVIVLLDSSMDGARNISSSIMNALEERNILHEYSKKEPKRVTVSIGGITITPDSNYLENDILHLADNELYKAKEEKNRFILSEK